MKATLIAAVLLAAVSASAQVTVYRTGNAYSDQPGGEPLYIPANVNVVERVWAPLATAPAQPPIPPHPPVQQPAPVIVQVTINRPAPLLINPRYTDFRGARYVHR